MMSCLSACGRHQISSLLFMCEVQSGMDLGFVVSMCVYCSAAVIAMDKAKKKEKVSLCN